MAPAELVAPARTTQVLLESTDLALGLELPLKVPAPRFLADLPPHFDFRLE